MASNQIKSRDMNEKGRDFIFYYKPYMPSAGLHGPLHMCEYVNHDTRTSLKWEVSVSMFEVSVAHTVIYP